MWDTNELQDERLAMVENQVRRRGLDDQRVLRAMRDVPRHLFVPGKYRSMAYEDRPLPIDQGQTISQPFMVALMAEAATIAPGDAILEIGTGSGYGAAVLGALAGTVVTVERHKSLAEGARAMLADAGATNVNVIHGDGTLGYEPGAPYDAIVVTAGGPSLPPTLVKQLKPGGRLIIPIGVDATFQDLKRFTLGKDGALVEDSLSPVRFVPLIGEEGWETSKR